MYYLILSWSECIEKLQTALEKGHDTCPVCHNNVLDIIDLSSSVYHLKRCYGMYKIDIELSKLPNDINDEARLDVISTVNNTVHEEINDYLRRFLRDSV